MPRPERLELIYKNLEHVSAAYFAAESVFPLWEAGFGLIIGQIFIAYYGDSICRSQQLQLAILGAIISAIWFIIVSLNLQHAIHIEKKVKELQELLNKELKNEFLPPLKFIEPWSWNKKDWTIENIFWGTEPKEEPVSKFEWLKRITKSTWFYRRALPFIICLIWISYLDIIFYGKNIVYFITIIILLWAIIIKPQMYTKLPDTRSISHLSLKPGEEAIKEKGWWQFWK